jgi:hypothetical protein
MGRKKKVVEEEPKSKGFQYGDLAVICKCGRTQIIHKGIEKGLQLVLTTNDESRIQLKCDECDADITLRFLEGEKPAEPVVNTEGVDENIQEESKQEPSL